MKQDRGAVLYDDLDIYRELLRVRELEERVSTLKADGAIAGSVHLCIGQEAVAVGTAALVRDQDALFSTYRGHGYAVALGVPPVAILAELLGRSGGVNGGRGGSAYFSAPDHGFYGENSIVGAGAPIATGSALAATLEGSDRVTYCVFGDGALNQGSVHEALNMAAAFRLPVVFVIENNGYSELTPIATMVGNDRLFKRASGYGMTAMRVDGNDVRVVATAVAEGQRRALSGQGPTFVEAMTQRLVGHYIGDLQQYRPPGEIEAAREVEPLARLEQQLVAAHRQTDLDGVRASVATEMDLAVTEALASPEPSPSTAKEHLYA